MAKRQQQMNQSGIGLLGAVTIIGLWFSAFGVQASTTRNDYGELGYLQMPSARMGEEGEFVFQMSNVSPYTRYTILAQPLPWLEASFRYTDVSNVLYGPKSLSGTQSLKDKGIDVRAKLLSEGDWLPNVAIGMRDIGGTGLFSSEYIVASKRWHDMDVSLGMGWGNIGTRGNVKNPFSLLSGRFERRSYEQTPGELRVGTYFSGRSSIFAGIEYAPPNMPFSFKVEYDGNNYQLEPYRNHQKVSSPINYGVTYKYSDVVTFHAGWERGNTAMLGMTFSTNLNKDFKQPKFDPPRQPLQETPAQTTHQWQPVAQALRANAGVKVEQIEQRGAELIVVGSQQKYLDRAKAEVRAASILHNHVGPEIKTFTFVERQRNLDLIETGVDRQGLQHTLGGYQDEVALKNQSDMTEVGIRHTESLYTEPPARFHYAFYPGLRQSLGGPDAFFLYQVTANVDLNFNLGDGWSFDSTLAAGVIDNFDKFDYTASSRLPRVRTNIREYLTSSSVNIPYMALNKTTQWGQGWYGLGYAGLLESMYAGVGAEVLYRPLDKPWALGADLNWVQQRGFKQDFELRDYRTLTGHGTLYYQSPFYDVLAKVSVGRYLAKDLGITFDLSRRFDTGVEIGGWATLTNVSAADFGEGSFDKGFYLRIPFDAFFTLSTTQKATVIWNPLTRDGGQRLYRPFNLYDMTSSRDTKAYYRSFEHALE